jgi:ATP-binding cassette subfamily F protein 3
MIVWQRPNLLLLDEPTNHLDLATREALAMALNEFEGTVMLVSHDRALLRSVCDEFWLVSRGGVEPFDGDLDDYQRYLLDEGKRLREELKQAGKAAEAPVAKPEPAPVAAKRAAPSGKLKLLKQSLEKLDKAMAALQAEKTALEAKLAGGLSVEAIAETGKQIQHLSDELAREEEKWMELSEQIEALETAGA